MSHENRINPWEIERPAAARATHEDRQIFSRDRPMLLGARLRNHEEREFYVQSPYRTTSTCEKPEDRQLSVQRPDRIMSTLEEPEDRQIIRRVQTEGCSYVPVKPSNTFNGCEAKAYDGGGHHAYVLCDGCMEFHIRGIRWKCLICADYDLCSKCYMSDKHNLDHTFKRILSVNSESAQKTVDNDVEHEEKRDNQLSLDKIFIKYPKHEVSDTYYEVSFDCRESTNKTIGVLLWGNLQQKKKKTFKPSLYLIFASPQKYTKSSRLELMEDVIDLARKTKLPCHIVELRVLFHSGSTKTACIHYRTDNDVIEELIKRGFHKFERGDIFTKQTVQNETDYFRRMVEYVTGEDVFPVIISIRNGGINNKMLKTAMKSEIPIIRFEQNNPNIRVLLPTPSEKEMQENIIDMETPWKVKQSKHMVYKIIEIKTQPQEIALLSEVQKDVENLVCCLLLGVYTEDVSSRKHGLWDYQTVLSMYLLTRGKWEIREYQFKPQLSQLSLEYIFEEVITSDFIKELWKSLSNVGFKPPEYKVPDSKDTAEDGMNTKECRIELIKWNSECYGLIFLALVKKHYWSGALQLIQTGFIRIPHILAGCVLLEEEANSWKTTPPLREKLQRAKSAFTERAIRITGCIYDDDRRNNVVTKKKEIGSKENKHHSDTFEDELGGCVNHAGRLLLNHGYLRNAINTKNRTYLKKDTVKYTLNKIWFGTKEPNRKWEMILIYFALAVAHLFVLPLLMINTETRTLRWFYKKYRLPFMKVFLQMLGFLFLVIAYAYMLLFDYRDDGITNTDCFIISWMASLIVDKAKQVSVAIIRRNQKSFAYDEWNLLDWLLIIVYTSGMLLKVGEGSGYRITSKLLLVAAFMAICIRILNMCFMTEFLGPKLVMIRRMVKDTIAFMIIMSVILVWYSVSFYALSYPNTEFSWAQIEKIISNGYWVLFGELNLDEDTLTEPECTFNRTIYESDELQRCPTQLGLHLTPYLKATYGLIAVVLLLNLLIAMYSHSFKKVQKQSEFYWRKIQIDFLEEYSIKTVFPIHLQLLALPGIIFSVIWFIYKKWRKQLPEESVKLNNFPMFVTVFLYDTNYDVKLKSTDVAEKYAAMESKGKIDLADFIAITGESDTDSTKLGIKNESDDKGTLELMNRLQNIEEKLNMLLDIR